MEVFRIINHNGAPNVVLAMGKERRVNQRGRHDARFSGRKVHMMFRQIHYFHRVLAQITAIIPSAVA